MRKTLCLVARHLPANAVNQMTLATSGIIDQRLVPALL
jgi:hypothetical protein